MVMKTEDWPYPCSLIANLSGIPVRWYVDRELRFFSALISLPRDPITLDLEPIFAVSSPVGWLVNDRFSYYGIVTSGQNRMVIGPTRQTALQDQELKELAFRLDVAPDDLDDFVTGMKQIVRLPLESMMQMLCAVNFMANGKKLTLNDLIGGKEGAFGLEESRAEKQMAEEDRPEKLHNTLAIEQTIMNIIRKGDVAALEAFVQDAPAVRPGLMAREQLRQAKNTFIVTAAGASRAAIRGGMDVEDALSASDAYIQQCELMTDMHQITKLNYDMVLFYTRQVQKVRHGHYATELVRNVANYIQHHLSEPITTEQIADSLYLSRQHLSRRFTEEAGIPLAAFVRNEKVEEAKRLLRYTDKPMAAISAYLGFSSQGHFAKVFKDLTGATPGEYRERKRS